MSKGKERAEKRKSPEEILLGAFDLFGAKEIDLESLVRVALASKCPNQETAKAVLSNMVSMGLLAFRKEGESVIFSKTEAPDERDTL